MRPIAVCSEFDHAPSSCPSVNTSNFTMHKPHAIDNLVALLLVNRILEAALNSPIAEPIGLCIDVRQHEAV